MNHSTINFVDRGWKNKKARAVNKPKCERQRDDPKKGMRRRQQLVALASVISTQLKGYECFSSSPNYKSRFPYFFSYRNNKLSSSTTTSAMPAAVVDATSSWSDLQQQVAATPVGTALNEEVILREQGHGSAHVQNKLRKFNSDGEPAITLYRDHAGWCPYCQKTMLLIEEKQVPIKIELVPMRSYGDKPAAFMRKVPNGLLPAIEVNGRIITESSVIMELLDEWHQDGYKSMMPSTDQGRQHYKELSRLERELFSWWCTLIFRPEGPSIGGGGAKNILSGLLGVGSSGQPEMSGSMQGFMDCIRKVDARLTATAGPWFFAEQDHPTMIDFVYVSHVERILASCAYWKGLNLRDPKWNLTGLVRWIEAFEKREAYLAFKSDYYTHVKDIPPQYGPGYAGGFADDRQKFESSITGRDGKSWSLPLSHDDPLQPLYVGPPLPLCVLRAAGLHADDSDGSYINCDPAAMADACRTMAAWKLAGNGINIVKFASRGGPTGAKNARKTFQAELADPYAEPDPKVQPHVDAVLRIVCQSLMKGGDQEGLSSLRTTLRAQVPSEHVRGVIGSIVYLRDRIGVPRDLPLAAARHLRAHLNWAINSFDD